MVERLSDTPFKFIERTHHIDLVAADTRLRFRVLKQKGNVKITHKKVESLIVDLIDKKAINLNMSQKRQIKLPESEHHIEGLHSDLVLEVARIKPFSIIQSATTIIRNIVGLFFGKKSPLTKQITAEFKNALKLLPTCVQKKIEENLHITNEEHYLMEYLASRIDYSKYTPEDKVKLLLEILNGGYIMIEDGGETYADWVRKLEQKKSRFSSHEASAEQFAVRGPLFKECLFSKKKIIENGVEREVTWMQLERYPVSFVYGALHLLSWALYKITGRNQGPWGESMHSEKANPIVLHLKPAL